MKADVLIKSNNRIVCQSLDGTTFEFSGNPKTGIPPHWFYIAVQEPHLHVHVETADGRLLTKGAVMAKKRGSWKFIALMILCTSTFFLGFYAYDIIHLIKSFKWM